MTDRWLLVLMVVIAALAGVAGYAVQRAAEGPPAVTTDNEDSAHSEGSALAHWSFDDIDGNERHMSEWAGQVLVINFWATWCPPCRKEIPGFIELQSRYADQSVTFIGIALDRADAIKPYALEQGINYPLLMGEERVTDYMRALGNEIGALPYSALLDRRGRIVARHQGEWSMDAVEAALKQLLAVPTGS